MTHFHTRPVLTSPVEGLTSSGVSVWLDDLGRDALVSGALRACVQSSLISGVTTNPTIFERAITDGHSYDQVIEELRLQAVGAAEAVLLLTAQDVRAAADVLAPVYAQTRARDGFVSIEVDPALAYDAEKTVTAARLMAWIVNRPNVMVKIPATTDSLPAVRRCLSEGISINVTLIFSPERYEEVLDAALQGMEVALERGIDLHRLRSVASVFVSRIDAAVDPLLGALKEPAASSFAGQAGISSAKQAYAIYRERSRSARWQRIVQAGGLVQRPLWASTGTKNPAYDDTLYVDQLVTPDAISTMPPATLKAFDDHGSPNTPVDDADLEAAAAVWTGLHDLGIDQAAVAKKLEDDGVAAFQQSWGSLIASMDVRLGQPRK